MSDSLDLCLLCLLKTNSMLIKCPHCGKKALSDKYPPGQPIGCPECGSLVEITRKRDGETGTRLIKEDPVHLKGFDKLEKTILKSSKDPAMGERLSGQWALFVVSLQSHAWIPSSIFTTGGLLAGLFLFYVGYRIGPLAWVLLGSVGLAVSVWTFAAAAVAAGHLIDLRWGNPKSSVGFFRSLRLLFEHRTGTLRRIGFWVFIGWVGFWLFNITVLGSSIIGLAGTTGRALLGALLGVQVLLTLSGLVWIGLILAALVTQPTMSLPSLSSKKTALMDGWRIWGPESTARRPLMVMTAGLISVFAAGGVLLRIGYRVVIQLNIMVAGKSLEEILSASPLAGLMNVPLAVEPSFSLQLAGITATISLAAVTGLLLGIIAHYWAVASHVFARNPGFIKWIKGRKTEKKTRESPT